MTSTMKRTIPLLSIVIMGLSLTGCSFQANLTTTPEQLESSVADALEEQAGERPDVDCGSDAIDLIDGHQVHCDVSSRTDGIIYDSVVTISEVKGADYHINVKVANEPKG